MSRRGEIVIECDTKDCHAEIVLPADAAKESGDSQAYRGGIGILLGAEGWAATWEGLDLCPECQEAIKANYDGPDDGESWSGGFAENH